MLRDFILWIREDFGRFSADGLSWSHQLHQSLFMWNVIEGTHVLAIMFFAGTIWMFDLRLMGIAFPKVRVSTLLKNVLPINKGAFAVMIVTGILAFIGRDPVMYYHNIWMRLKMVFLLLALANVLFFDYKTKRGLLEWDTMPPEDPAAPAHKRTKMPLYVLLGASVAIVLSFLTPDIGMTLTVLLRLALGIVALVALFMFIDRRRVTPPRAVKLAGAISLASWMLVIVFGRFIAYDWFNCDKIKPDSLAYGLQNCSAYLAGIESAAVAPLQEAPAAAPAAESRTQP